MVNVMVLKMGPFSSANDTSFYIVTMYHKSDMNQSGQWHTYSACTISIS